MKCHDCLNMRKQLVSKKGKASSFCILNTVIQPSNDVNMDEARRHYSWCHAIYNLDHFEGSRKISKKTY